MTASSHCCLPVFYGMKPTNLASSYCPTFSFRNHHWRRYCLLVRSELLVAAQRSRKLCMDLVANSSPGLGPHAWQLTRDIFHRSPFMSTPNWTGWDHFTARYQASFQPWVQSSWCKLWRQRTMCYLAINNSRPFFSPCCQTKSHIRPGFGTFYKSCFVFMIWFREIMKYVIRLVTLSLAQCILGHASAQATLSGISLLLAHCCIV